MALLSQSTGRAQAPTRLMGFMRKLGPRQQARVRAVKEKRGFEAAIGVAKGMTAR